MVIIYQHKEQESLITNASQSDNFKYKYTNRHDHWTFISLGIGTSNSAQPVSFHHSSVQNHSCSDISSFHTVCKLSSVYHPSSSGRLDNFVRSPQGWEGIEHGTHDHKKPSTLLLAVDKSRILLCLPSSSMHVNPSEEVRPSWFQKLSQYFNIQA